MNEPNGPSDTRGWDTYWQTAEGVDAYASAGESHPAITSFWDDTLSQILAPAANARILDIATGSGAVVEKLTHHNTYAHQTITCLDISDAAIDSVRRKFPAIVGIVADARSIPLESSAYDLVTSQFGIEYAGLDALDEAARLIAPGGELALLMHIRPGLVFDDCRRALDAVQRTQKSEFMELSLRFLEAGFAAVQGADRAPYDQAALDLNPAIEQIESILSEHGEQVAGGIIANLYSDVQRMHTRIQYYDSEEVVGWINTMVRELLDYGARMASMCDAALDEMTFADVGERLRNYGLTITQEEALLPGDDTLAVAWALRAVRAD